MTNYINIVLTGGPGGGKTTLIEELQNDPEWSGKFTALPETIFMMRDIGFSPKEKPFQRVIMELQMAMEDGLNKSLDRDNPYLILCHRGSLDPLGYWLNCGWTMEEFYTYTGTTREEHYRRYAAVIHLVTAADGAEEFYHHWPNAHRHENPEEAIHLDRLLGRVWENHPLYYRITNKGNDWSTKSLQVRRLLEDIYQTREK